MAKELDSSDTTQMDPRDQRIAELEAQLRARDAVIAELQEQVRQLQERLDGAKRAGKRQATPFAREKRVAKPKRPGRKKGKGRFASRPRPTPEEVTETKREPLTRCPECNGKVIQRKEHEQFVVDIPPVKPVITRYVTESGYCQTCQKRVRSRHPEQISEATGAAGVVIGPRAKALVADMKHRFGASYGKVCGLLEDAFGLRATRSGWYQADMRLARQARPVYEELVEVLQESAVVHADETGWRIGTLSAWLWVFTNQETTVYTIQRSRGHKVVLDILGTEFAGILNTDCFLAYDAKALDDWLKQKCVGHLLRNLSEMEARKTRGAVRFARNVTQLLKDALQLKAEKANVPPAAFVEQAVALEERLDQLCHERRRFTDPDNARFAKRLRKHREHLLRFLYVDELDATNNLAERQLRPAVITRKTTGCNRTLAGAETHSILSSVLTTCHQRNTPILDFLTELQRATGVLPSLGSPQPVPT